MILNPEQELAANHINGPCLVTACPGSGKTRTIVERTARLINNNIAPSELLCITFTNKAAAEMRERIEKHIGGNASSIFVATFHRLCSSILRYHGNHLGYNRNMTILDDDGQIDLLSQCARQLEFELTKADFKKILWHINDSREKLESDSELNNRLDNVDPQFYSIAKEYIRRMRVTNTIDFSGLLTETIRLLREYPVVLEKAQSKWKYALVDELQDTNIAQFVLVELLFSHTKNIFMVGDLDQSIYGWRGSHIGNISDFINRYSPVAISLGKNYRSTPEIVARAGALINHNSNRIAANFATDNPSGEPVLCKAFSSDREEAEYVASTIINAVGSGQYQYKDVAIFYRINSMSRAIEMALVNAGIPHTMIGGFSFYDRKEIKDCLSMLKFLINPFDGVSFHRIANKPARSLGDVTIGKIEKVANQKNISILEAIDYMDFKAEGVRAGLHEIQKAFNIQWKSATIAENLNYLIQTLKYRDFLDADPDTAEERKQNLDELIRDAVRWGEEQSNDIGAYLEHVCLMSSYDKEADGNSVSLMTLHGSKGLEFPVVFMLGVEQEILPHKMAVAERADGLEEERRLAYVGMTRAKEILTMCYCKFRQENSFGKAGKMRYRTSMPSQFLFEAGLLDINDFADKAVRRNG